MALLSREVTFMMMLATSLIIGGLVRLLGQFRFKKEILSIIGILQLTWFCGMDTIHLLVLMLVGTLLIQVNSLGPRTVFVYCFLHRIFFSSSKYLGLPRDESNLANATMFISTLKMVIVAYEVADYRSSKKNTNQSEQPKLKWINLDKEPTAYDILCYMTCFVAIFTGPIFRYKTYNDMLVTCSNVPIKQELISKMKTCVILCALFLLSPFNPGFYKGSFYEHRFAERLLLMVAIVLGQVAKYAIAWLLAECVCLMVGLGAYPVSTEPSPGMGPTKEENTGKEEIELNFETVSTMKIVDSLFTPTLRGTLQNWNCCTQWWLAYFVYASTVLPRNWRMVRAFNVMLISAALHGVKPGYFLSFPTLCICLLAEQLMLREVEGRIPWKKVLSIYKVLHWWFYKMMVVSFLFTIFILQEYDEIKRFCLSVYFYGYIVPIACLLAALIVNFVSPIRQAKKLE